MVIFVNMPQYGMEICKYPSTIQHSGFSVEFCPSFAVVIISYNFDEQSCPGKEFFRSLIGIYQTDSIQIERHVWWKFLFYFPQWS